MVSASLWRMKKLALSALFAHNRLQAVIIPAVSTGAGSSGANTYV
jgi:hypothetical protein